MKKCAFLFLVSFISFSVNNLFSQKVLHLYGGKEHDVYLGCLNCDRYNSNSIWNANGTYGSRYNTNSLWNSYGNYGGKYSSYSPFNSYSNTPPIILDKDGNSYGYLTVNKYKSRRADFKLALIICDNWEEIKEDVSGWYEKIFN